MPNKVAANIRWKTFEAIVDRLGTITKSAGYNHQPLVTDDGRKVENAAGTTLLFVRSGSESVQEYGMSSRWTMLYEIIVEGYVPCAGLRPEKEIAALLQDVRTCLCSYISGLATAIGQGCVIEMGEADSDQGYLAEDYYAAFVLPIRVLYLNQATF